MAKYFYLALAIIFCSLVTTCLVLYVLNAKLKAENITLTEALETSIESNALLAANIDALKIQMTKQEQTCREQVKRTQSVYYSMVLSERQACTKKDKSLVNDTLLISTHPRGLELSAPAPVTKTTEVISDETSSTAIDIINDVFRVQPESGL